MRGKPDAEQLFSKIVLDLITSGVSMRLVCQYTRSDREDGSVSAPGVHAGVSVLPGQTTEIDRASSVR